MGIAKDLHDLYEKVKDAGQKAQDVDQAIQKYNKADANPTLENICDFAKSLVDIAKWSGLLSDYFEGAKGIIDFIAKGPIGDYSRELDKWREILANENRPPSSTPNTYRIVRYDPLALDLDGDGVETVGTDSRILFDHNNDGISTTTGWIKSDDGLLVRDINGNGTIDSGAELFGDNTILSNGQTATCGFNALSDLDTNADGKVDASDTAFNELKVCRSLWGRW